MHEITIRLKIPDLVWRDKYARTKISRMLQLAVLELECLPLMEDLDSSFEGLEEE